MILLMTKFDGNGTVSLSSMSICFSSSAAFRGVGASPAIEDLEARETGYRIFTSTRLGSQAPHDNAGALLPLIGAFVEGARLSLRSAMADLAGGLVIDGDEDPPPCPLGSAVSCCSCRAGLRLG